MECIFGHVEMVTTMGFADGKMLLGGYSKTYDRDGRFVSRTPNQWNVAMSFE